MSKQASYIQLSLFNAEESQSVSGTDGCCQPQVDAPAKDIVQPARERIAEEATDRQRDPVECEVRELFNKLYSVILKVSKAKRTLYNESKRLQVAAVAQRYIDGKIFSDIANGTTLTTERIRQLCVQFISRLIDTDSPTVALVRKLNGLAPRLIGLNADRILRKDDGKPLSSNLLEIIGMTSFVEEVYAARQSFIVITGGANSMRIHNAELVKYLRIKISPITCEELDAVLCTAVEQRGETYNPVFVRQLIKGNEWIVEEDGGVRLKYEGFNLPTQRLRNIIFEHKKIRRKELVRIYKEREHALQPNLQKNLKEPALVLVAKGDERFFCIGKRGVWVFSEQGDVKPQEDIRTFLQRYVADMGKPFSFKKLAELCCSMGYEYPEHSLRCYLAPLCCRALRDNDLCCPIEATNAYPHIDWSKKKKGLTRNRIPEYYQNLRDLLVSALSSANPQQLPMKEVALLLKANLPSGRSATIVYKLLRSVFADVVEEVLVEDEKYIRLK